MSKILVLKSEKIGSCYEAKVKSVEVGDEAVSYELLRKEMGGYLEMVALMKELEDARIDFFCDEEGKLKGLSPTVFVFRGEENELVDIVCGNVIFAANDGEGETYGLSDSQIEKVKEVLKVIEFTVDHNKQRFFSMHI